MEFRNVLRLVLALVSITPSQARVIKPISGLTFDGHPTAATKSTVYFISESGSVRLVPRSNLSTADQKYASDWQLSKGRDDLVFELTKKRISKKNREGKVYESFKYDGKLTNRGTADLSNLNLTYTLYFRGIGQHPEKRRQGRAVALRDKIVIKQLAKGQSNQFTTGKVDVVSVKAAHKLGENLQPGSPGQWREELAGIVIETFVGDQIIDLFEYHEPSWELIKRPLTWLKKSGERVHGYYLHEEGEILRIEQRGAAKKLVLIAKRDLDPKFRIGYERLKQRYRPSELHQSQSKRVYPRPYSPATLGEKTDPREDIHPNLAENIQVNRHWTGKNGTSLYGRIRREEDDTIYIFRQFDRKMVKVSKDALSLKDLQWLEKVKEREAAIAAAKPRPIDATGVKRSNIPILDQGKYGMKASDCVPNSYASFFVWWDLEEKIPIHKGRDFEAKAEWIHRELSKRCGTTNNGGTDYRSARKGLQSYFDTFLKGRFAMELDVIYDISPASLSKYTKGLNATVLSLNTFKGKRIRRANAGYHAVTLIDVQPDGRIELSTWGSRLTGKMVPSEEKIPENKPVPKGVPRVIYEIVFDPDCDFPSWFKQYNYRFLIDPSNWSQLRVLSVGEFKKK